MTVDAHNCYLLELTNLYTGKIFWGLDCELEEIKIAIKKVLKYRYLKNTNDDDCDFIFPIELQFEIEKFDRFLKSRNNKKTKFCKTCK